MAVTYAVLCLVLIPVEVVTGGNTFTLLPENIFFKNYGNASSCVTEHEEETCKLITPIPLTKWLPSSWSTLTSIWIHYSGSIRNCYRSEWILLTEKTPSATDVPAGTPCARRCCN
uniref:Uncharacterized protein n=1 Tax=Shigella flexneri 2a TaxID=42897 RepID=Q9AL55_SHIFL|nr:unknown [Shigella flexneri 2a]